MFEMMDPSDDQDPADPPAPADDGLVADDDLLADDDGGLVPVDELADDLWLDAALQEEAVRAVCDLEAELAAEAAELDADGTLERLTAVRQAERRAQADRLVLGGPMGGPARCAGQTVGGAWV